MFTNVTGTFEIPRVSEPSYSSGLHGVSVWAGIGGVDCSDSFLLTGINFAVDDNNDGNVSYQGQSALLALLLACQQTICIRAAFYQLFPGPPIFFSDAIFNVGDSVTLTITATSGTSGTVNIINHNTGQIFSESPTTADGAQLCMNNAEWFVEDLDNNGTAVSFADFGTITFTDAFAQSGSAYVDLSGAIVVVPQQNSTILTSVSISQSTVTISYD